MRFSLIFGFYFVITVALGQDAKAVGELNQLLDSWHKNATLAKFEAYFDATSDHFVFYGTAPAEKWDKEAFKTFCKPYFDSKIGRAHV